MKKKENKKLQIQIIFNYLKSKNYLLNIADEVYLIFLQGKKVNLNNLFFIVLNLKLNITN